MDSSRQHAHNQVRHERHTLGIEWTGVLSTVEERMLGGNHFGEGLARVS